MADKPEALRLAAELDQYLYTVPAHPLCTDTSAELRRLHDLLGKANSLCRIRAAEIERLNAEKAELLEALRLIAATDPVDAALDPERAIRIARAAIAKAEGE
jgi:hypothetical protein